VSVCSHRGLVEKGMNIFWFRKDKYQVCANKEHYACVVDHLCCAGKVEEAYELMKMDPLISRL